VLSPNLRASSEDRPFVRRGLLRVARHSFGSKALYSHLSDMPTFRLLAFLDPAAFLGTNPLELAVG
jgi:hypothetical protein